VERFILRNLSDLEVRKEYQMIILNMSAALENLHDREDVNRLGGGGGGKKYKIKNPKKKRSLGLCELKQHKPRFDEECS
jgi:hypothetical protein